jgi:hypothetical protein
MYAIYMPNIQYILYAIYMPNLHICTKRANLKNGFVPPFSFRRENFRSPELSFRRDFYQDPSVYSLIFIMKDLIKNIQKRFLSRPINPSKIRNIIEKIPQMKNQKRKISDKPRSCPTEKSLQRTKYIIKTSIKGEEDEQNRLHIS